MLRISDNSKPFTKFAEQYFFLFKNYVMIVFSFQLSTFLVGVTQHMTSEINLRHSSTIDKYLDNS